MVLQVPANALMIRNGIYADASQVIGRTNSGEHQDVRGANRSGTENDLSCGRNSFISTSNDGRRRARSPVLDFNAGDVRPSYDSKVGTLCGRAQKGNGGALPTTVRHRKVEPAESLLFGAVEVVGPGVAGLFACLDERIVKRVPLAGPGDPERSAISVKLVVAVKVGLGFAKVGQYVLIGPASVPKLRPVIEI